MKKILIEFCCLIFLIGYFAPVEAAVNIQRWQTANGAQVYFVASKAVPMLQMNVLFRAGSAFDGSRYGLAYLTNRLLNNGTAKLTVDQIAQRFDQVGAIYDASVSRDVATVSLQSLTDAKYLTPSLQTFASVLTQPAFPSDQFQLEQKLLLRSIQQQSQLPAPTGINAFYKAVYGNQPYGHPIIGTSDSLPPLTSAEVKQFYQRYYVGKNAVVIMVGNVTAAQAKQIAMQIVGGLPAGQAALPLSIVKATANSKTEQINFPTEQTTIYLGQIGIARNNPDYFPLIVGNYILGEGMNSRLFETIRNQQGLAYTVTSEFLSGLTQGPFIINMQTRNAKAKESVDLARKILTEYIQQGPTAAELNFTKKYLQQSFPLRLSSNTAILANVSNMAFYQLPLDYLDTYKKNVGAVTAEQIKQAFQRYVYPDKLALVTVGKQP